MSTTLIILLCALACPLGMAAMMLFMRKGHGRQQAEDETDERSD